MNPLGRNPLLRKAWLDWVTSANVKWELFGTFTFSYQDLKPHRAARLFHRYLRKLSRKYRGAERGTRMVPALASVEQHANGELHVHAAIADYTWPRDAEKSWPHGIAKVERFNSAQAGLAYVIKHVDRGSDVWVTDETFQKK